MSEAWRSRLPPRRTKTVAGTSRALRPVTPPGWGRTGGCGSHATSRPWRKPAAWAGTTRIAGMDAPAEMVGLTAADELVVHGWDVARATGQPYACEPELLAAAASFLGQFASPDAPAGPDVAFGPSRQVPVGAPELDRVVALAGRDPGWSLG